MFISRTSTARSVLRSALFVGDTRYIIIYTGKDQDAGFIYKSEFLSFHHFDLPDRGPVMINKIILRFHHPLAIPVNKAIFILPFGPGDIFSKRLTSSN